MTQENKFTPAPWVTGQVSWDEETKDVRYTLHGVKEARVADCKLISAAPDLFEALDDILKCEENRMKELKEGAPAYRFALERIERANQALKKARGEV